jgi:Domain of unknown function (DUF4114)
MKAVSAIVGSFVFGVGLLAQTVSPVQSGARPFGLGIADPVMLAGSDASSAQFQNSVLPGLTTYLAQILPEGQRINQGSQLFDPSKIRLTTDADVRVYFVSESSAAANTLGLDVTGSGPRTSEILFPNASSGTSRTASTPLQPGDFVDAGNFSAGQKLDFFLVAQKVNGGGRGNSGNGSSANNDLIRNVVSFATVYGSYLVIGFEETMGNGSDRDFNDLLFAIDLGSVNMAAMASLTATPEPATWVMLGSFLAGGFWLVRSRRKAAC